MTKYFLTLCSVIISIFQASAARAAIFDAPDFLSPGTITLGGFGELALSDPSSEGAELRARYGLNDDWNVGAMFGVGTKNKKTRMGGEVVFNFMSDVEGQIGISALASMIYIKRYDFGGMYMRLAPMTHKSFTAWNDNRGMIYVAVPFTIDIRNSTYETGSQLVVGTHIDADSSGHYYLSGEAGIRLARDESYVLVGGGIRFGDVEPSKQSKASSYKKPTKEEEEEYRTDDFATPAK